MGTLYLTDGDDLASVANAIRAKSGGSGQLAFPSGFVSEIGNIPSGGGGVHFASGTIVLSAASASVIVSVPFAPQHALIYALNSDVNTENNWKTLASVLCDYQTDGIRIIRHGASSWNMGHFSASSFTYDSSAEEFKFVSGDSAYKFQAGISLYWYAWRDD